MDCKKCKIPMINQDRLMMGTKFRCARCDKVISIYEYENMMKDKKPMVKLCQQ